MRKITIEQLREICQLNEEEKRPVCIGYFYRRISIFVTALLIRTGITANEVSGIDIVAGLLGAFFLSFGNYWYSIMGGLMLCIFVLFDCVDGEVARYRRYMDKSLGNASGSFSENIKHVITIEAVLVGITYGIFRTTNDLMVFAFGFLALSSFMLWEVVTFYTQSLSVSSAIKEPTNGFLAFNRVISLFRRIREAVFKFFSVTFVPTMVLFMAVVNQLYIFLILYAAYSFLYATFHACSQFMRLRSSKSFEDAVS